MKMFAALQVTHLDGRLFFRTYKQPIPREIHAEMIPLSLNARDGNTLHQTKRFRFLSGGHRRVAKHQNKKNKESPHYEYTLFGLARIRMSYTTSSTGCH